MMDEDGSGYIDFPEFVMFYRSANYASGLSLLNDAMAKMAQTEPGDNKSSSES
jgi:Ca2+-binding EF-hand superfamily protein